MKVTLTVAARNRSALVGGPSGMSRLPDVGGAASVVGIGRALRKLAVSASGN